MKKWRTALTILTALFASIALADDFKTINGKEYKNAEVSRVESDGIVLKTKSGISKVYFIELPEDVQKRFGYDAAKIAELQKRQQERIAAAERERDEKEKNADMDLRRAAEEFQAAEQRASEAYQSAAKGTLSGQVFVSSKGGENFKLGAVQVELFARDAIDVLVKGAKNYADVKIQQLSGPVAEAKAAFEQAAARARADYGFDYRDRDAAEEARDAAKKARDAAQEKLDSYYSGPFYFSLLYSPIQTAETDGDGKFAIEVPKQGSFVIAAKAERYLREVEIEGEHIPIKEHYYWLQPVSLEGQPQRVQNLSNNNLTSTTGTSALIHTED